MAQDYVYVLAPTNRTYRYPDARIVVGAHGHLIIKDGKDRIVAAFEPGKWFAAECRQDDAHSEASGG